MYIVWQSLSTQYQCDEKFTIAERRRRIQHTWKKETQEIFAANFDKRHRKRFRTHRKQIVHRRSNKRTRIGQPKFWINTTDSIVLFYIFPDASIGMLFCFLLSFIINIWEVTLFIVTSRASSVDPSRVLSFIFSSLF